MDEADLPKELRLSDLRRTGTTEMVDAGVGIAQIMSVTGHSNPQSVKPYLKNTLSSADYALTQRKKHDISITSAAKESDNIHE
jgi:integrase